jgi:hypothetical protein
MTSNDQEYSGEECIVLPKDYMNSPQAAAEIFEEELAAAVNDLHVDNLGPERGFFSGMLSAVLIWLIPSAWTVCL